MTVKIINILFVMWYLLPANTTFAQGYAEWQSKKDDALLNDYFTRNNLKPQKTESGIYYLIHKKGRGRNAQPGDVVTLNYTGKTLDDRVFDSNTDPRFLHVEPITFVLGKGKVIEGWDLGIQLLNTGSDATLYVPSGLAYGQTGSGHAIRKNAILIFDVELTAIRDR
jgi:FKBP-type peptidyl-prolyl cis-trans isomerase FkpA